VQFSWRFKEYNKDRRSSSITDETKLLAQMLATGLSRTKVLFIQETPLVLSDTKNDSRGSNRHRSTFVGFIVN